jgi:hypothetical protein
MIYPAFTLMKDLALDKAAVDAITVKDGCWRVKRAEDPC